MVAPKDDLALGPFANAPQRPCYGHIVFVGFPREALSPIAVKRVITLLSEDGSVSFHVHHLCPPILPVV